MNAKELIEEYKKNGLEIERIGDETKIKTKQAEARRETQADSIYKRRRLLDEEEAIMRQDHTERIAIIDGEEDKLTEPLHNQRVAVKRIIEFLEVQEKFKPCEMEEARASKRYSRDEGFLEWQEWIHNDDYLKIRLLISENDKPVNKYTASVYIASIFHKPLIELPYSPKELNSFKTVEEAKAYIAKKKEKLFQDEIKAIEVLKLEYLKVIEAYKLSDFEVLFEYYCTDCRAKFKTIPESHEKEVITGYKNDTPIKQTVKCNPEYGWCREVIS